ncbi:MAG: hemerythrin domain-containing protein [Syntrophobacteraceae bacterium]
MPHIKSIPRRNFLALAGAGLLAGCQGSNKPPAEAATAIEIFDRHHGLLRRAIAILEEIRGGMDARMDLPPGIIGETVEVIRHFGIDYHQKLEEKHIFPAFDAAKKMGALVGVLREQHAAGSQLTEVIKELSAGFSAKDLEKRRTMGSAIHQFSRMYRAHSDREETVLFPALRPIMVPGAYAELASAFQNTEKEVLGQNGFEQAIQKLEVHENTLGIGDLAAFTPHADELTLRPENESRTFGEIPPNQEKPGAA